jgi:hypothetical protein
LAEMCASARIAICEIDRAALAWEPSGEWTT